MTNKIHNKENQLVANKPKQMNLKQFKSNYKLRSNKLTYKRGKSVNKTKPALKKAKNNKQRNIINIKKQQY